MIRIGGLWSKASKKDGKRYLEGTLQLKVIIFKTDEKRSEKSPDFVLYLKDEVQDGAKPKKVVVEDVF